MVELAIICHGEGHTWPSDQALEQTLVTPEPPRDAHDGLSLAETTEWVTGEMMGVGARLVWLCEVHIEGTIQM